MVWSAGVPPAVAGAPRSRGRLRAGCPRSTIIDVFSNIFPPRLFNMDFLRQRLVKFPLGASGKLSPQRVKPHQVGASCQRYGRQDARAPRVKRPR
jgi:hypothetical protein